MDLDDVARRHRDRPAPRRRLRRGRRRECQGGADTRRRAVGTARPRRSGIRWSTIPTGTRTRRLDDWRAVVEQTRTLPPTLAAAIAADAWDAIDRCSTRPGSAGCWPPALLRARAKTRWHLPCLHAGLKAIPRERRRPRDAAAQLAVQLEAITAAAAAGLKDHDRWLNQRTLLARKLAGRRATSKLPALLDYVLTRPDRLGRHDREELKITPRAAQDLVAELGLREATGRGRYRAWGIL